MKLKEFLLGKDFAFSSSVVMGFSSYLCGKTQGLQTYMMKQYCVVHSDGYDLPVYYKSQISVQN